MNTHCDCNECTFGLAFYSLCVEEGIGRVESLPYTPEQNGPSERAGKTIIERAHL